MILTKLESNRAGVIMLSLKHLPSCLPIIYSTTAVSHKQIASSSDDLPNAKLADKVLSMVRGKPIQYV